MNGSMRPQYSTPSQVISDTAPTTLNDMGVSPSGSSVRTLALRIVWKKMAFRPATTRKHTFAHQVGLLQYCTGSAMKNVVPVTRLIANPKIAQGINSNAALTGI